MTRATRIAVTGMAFRVLTYTIYKRLRYVYVRVSLTPHGGSVPLPSASRESSAVPVVGCILRT